MNQMHYNQEKSPKRTPANVARKAFWDAALGDNSKLANLAKAAITEAEQQAKVRGWVGLTDEEIETILQGVVSEFIAAVADKRRGTMLVQTMVRAIESKLHEKNAGQPVADDKAGGEPVAWREFLARMEWSDWRYDRYGQGQAHCPDCGNQKEDGHGEDCELSAMLYTHPQPQAEVRVPDGYVLVPVEPTDDMLNCAQDRVYSLFLVDARNIWDAMLSAAPKPQEDLPAILKKQAS